MAGSYRSIPQQGSGAVKKVVTIANLVVPFQASSSAPFTIYRARRNYF